MLQNQYLDKETAVEPGNDYPPERYAHDCMVAIKDMLDTNDLDSEQVAILCNAMTVARIKSQ